MFKFCDPHEKTGKLQNSLRPEGHERLVRCVFKIESVLKEIVSTSDSLYRSKDIAGGGLARLVKSKLDEDFVRLFVGLPVILRCRKYYNFNPYVSMFVDVANRQAKCLWGMPNLSDARDVSISAVDALQSCVEELRGLGRSSDFKYGLRNYRRLSGKNYSELEGYIDGLFLNWPRLMVVRLELGYRWPDSTEKFEEPISDDERIRGFERLVEDRVELIKLVRKKANNRFVGFIWKLNYGPDLSYRYHLMLFFDGFKVSEDLHWAEMIGEVWVKEVTQGDGVYFNFNRVESGHWCSGIGMVQRGDEKKRESLMKAVTYLTKPDDYLRIVTPRSARALGKGQLPRARKARGRQES